MDLLPPSTQMLILVPHPSSMLILVQPPRKPPDKSGKLYGFCLPVRTLSVFVQVLWCIKGYQAVKVKIAHYVFVGMPLQRWVIWKTKIWQGPYGVVISFCNLFMFWLSFNLLIKVDIIETTYSRNVLAAIVILIRNWIDKKTMDSLLFVIMDRGRKIFQCRELGYICWFSGKMLAFSQSTVSIDHVFVVFNGRNFLLSIWSLSKSYCIIFIVICLELFFVE